MHIHALTMTSVRSRLLFFLQSQLVALQYRYHGIGPQHKTEPGYMQERQLSLSEMLEPVGARHSPRHWEMILSVPNNHN